MVSIYINSIFFITSWLRDSSIQTTWIHSSSEIEVCLHDLLSESVNHMAIAGTGYMRDNQSIIWSDCTEFDCMETISFSPMLKPKKKYLIPDISLCSKPVIFRCCVVLIFKCFSFVFIVKVAVFFVSFCFLS